MTGKLSRIWSELDEPLNIKSCWRLGQSEVVGKQKAHLVTLTLKQVRDKILGKTMRLKETDAP